MSARRRFVPALVLSSLALVACLPRMAAALDPLVPGQVLEVLNRLGLTTNGAAPSGTSGYVWTANGAGAPPTFQAAAGGAQTPWTADVASAGYRLTGTKWSLGDSPTGDGLANRFTLQGATGSGSTAGQDVYLRGGGTTTSHNDYSRLILGGETGAGVGGTVTAIGGAGTTGQAGGDVSIIGGHGNSGAAVGGSIICRGASGAGVAGTVAVTGNTTITGTASITGSVALTGRYLMSQSWTATYGVAPIGGVAAPAFTTRNGHSVLAFDDTTIETVDFEGVCPGTYYITNSLTVEVEWIAASATSGDVDWGASFEDFAGLDLDADSFAAERAAVGTADATSGKPTRTTITFTSAQADTLLPLSDFRLRVRRVASDGTDTMTGDAQILAVRIYQ